MADRLPDTRCGGSGGVTLSKKSLVFRYVAFALVASIVNIVAQEACAQAYSGWISLEISIFAGTVVGIVIKYILDKFFIFFDRTITPSAEVAKLTLYVISSILTTGLFWFIEIGSWIVWRTNTAKWLGAAVGLAIGYFIKYHLDKRFAFRRVVAS